jgi:hypothetical protein
VVAVVLVLVLPEVVVLEVEVQEFLLAASPVPQRLTPEVAAAAGGRRTTQLAVLVVPVL